MSVGPSTLAYRRLRAPREHGAVLIEPSLPELPAMVAANVDRHRLANYDLHGRSLQTLSTAGRRELVDLAVRYTSSYRPVAAPVETQRLFVAGHQPELFHPGVWYKNFVLSRVAREQHATAVNLVIDSDTIKHVSLRVPGGSLEAPVVDAIPFDASSDEIPHEERDIEDRALFTSFGDRVCDQIKGIVPAPLMRQFWPLVLERMQSTRNLGACVAQARHVLEGAWGLDTLEIPQSQVCSLPSFHWFAAHLLCELPRFRSVYNSAVDDYRRVNKVRSANHPVPNLAEDGEWLEAPFWLWSTSAPRRRRVFARRHAGGMTLTDRRRVEFELPLCASSDPTRAVEVLAGLPAQGIKLRSRALVTTLFARLVLSDWFLHGVGGAKYDQLTDELIRRFFGLEPPGYLVISATLHLATPPGAPPADLRQLDHELRDIDYHPEQYLAPSEQWAGAPVDIERWLSLKSQWLATEQTRENARERCHAIRAANEALQAWIEPRRRELLRERQEAQRAWRVRSMLTSREYAFCLYSEATLRSLFGVSI